MKNKTFVAIFDVDKIRYVTEYDNANKQAWWANGKPALAMSKSTAENLYFGLRCNGYRACIITMPDYETPYN